jgi:hypothetical protein
MVEIGRDRPGPLGEGQRRVAFQRRVTACRVVITLELGKLAFQVEGIPEQHLVEEFSPHRAALTIPQNFSNSSFSRWESGGVSRSQ